MKSISINVVALLFCAVLFVGCAAHHVSNGTPPAPVSTLEQANYDNFQIAVHNRAVAKAVTAARQAGFIEKEYYDVISREGINITKVHQQLTPLLKDQAGLRINSATIKTLLNTLISSADTIADAAFVKDPNVKQQLVSEAQLIGSLANTILNLLQGAGLISDSWAGPEAQPIELTYRMGGAYGSQHCGKTCSPDRGAGRYHA